MKFCNMAVIAGWDEWGDGEGTEMDQELDKC